MNIDEILDKKLCALCHQNPMGRGIICDMCRNNPHRMEDIIDKKLKRIEAEKIEQIYTDFKKDVCIKCHSNPSLVNSPYCSICGFGETK